MGERPDRVIVKQARNDDDQLIDQFYWVQVAPNGEDLDTSETYGQHSDAVEAGQRQADKLGATLIDATSE